MFLISLQGMTIPLSTLIPIVASQLSPVSAYAKNYFFFCRLHND